MRDISLRTIGASLVLLGLAVAALLQLEPGFDRNAVAITLEGSLDRADATPDQPPGSEDASTTTTTAGPFIYRLGVLSGITTDNFWAFYGEQPSVWNSYILGPTKPTLLRLNPVKSALEPEVARWLPGPSFDGTSWFVDVPLRDDLTWSDGTPITAEDYVFTFETVRTLGLGGSWATSFPEAVVAVEAPSSNRVRIVFSGRPTIATWPNGVGTAPIMPAHVWSQVVPGLTAGELFADSTTPDVDGGPLVLTEIGDGFLSSFANPGYPLSGGPERVDYQVFPDEGSMIEALMAGDIDAVLNPKGISAESSSLVEESDTISKVTSPSNAIRYLGFNLRREPMADLAFRRALALLVDRDHLATSVGNGARPAYTIIREANDAWYETGPAAELADITSGHLQARLDEALAGLKSAGYGWDSEPVATEEGSLVPGTGLTINGQPPAPLTILTPGGAYDPTMPAYVTQIASMLGALGFDARPVVTDFDTVLDLAFGHDDQVRQYDMYLLGWTLGNPALPDYYRPLFSSTGEMNNTGYSSPEFDERLTAYESAATHQEARQQLWEMEKILARDLPYLVLYSLDLTEAYRIDRIEFGLAGNLGGIQARLGGIDDVMQLSN